MVNVVQDISESTIDVSTWFAVDELLSRCMDNVELADRVLSRFQGSLGETVQHLELLAGQGDWEGLAKQSHRLKGEAGNCGSRPIVELASELEAACGADQSESVRSLLQQLTGICEIFQRQPLSLSEVEFQGMAGGRVPVSCEL
ncbi:MAG: Hpt domain-containing protein [Planctomycetota bacterium]